MKDFVNNHPSLINVGRPQFFLGEEGFFGGYDQLFEVRILTKTEVKALWYQGDDWSQVFEGTNNFSRHGELSVLS